MPSEFEFASASIPAGILSEADVKVYHAEGYVILRNIFDPHEIASLRADADRVREEQAENIVPRNMRIRFKSHHETDEPLFEVFDPFADLSPVARSIARDRRILDRLHSLYGEPAELFKDKLIYKPPGVLGAALHQDWISWPEFPESFVTVLVAIDSFTAENGATEVFPRVHKQGYLSPKDGRYHPLEIGDWDAAPVPLLLEPGDLAIFSCFTPHRSAPNATCRARRGYFISYNARSDGGDQYEAHYREFRDWMRSQALAEYRSLLFFR